MPGLTWSLARGVARDLALVVAVTVATLVLPASARAEQAGIALFVPYRGQLDGSYYAGSNCGPAALAMVLNGYGREVEIAEVRAAVNDLQGTWGNPNAGTAIENLGVIARRHGVTPLDLAAGGRMRRWTFDDLRRHLDAGHPVVPQVWYRGLVGREQHAYNGDHFIVLVGYQGDEFFYHDPIDRDGVGPDARISAEQLERAWRESDLPFAALAFAGPPERPTLQPPPTPTATAAPPATATSSATATTLPTATPSPMPTMTPWPSPTAPPSPTASPPPPPAAVVTTNPPPDGEPPARSPAPWPVGDHGGLALLVIGLLAAHRLSLVGRWPAVWRATAPTGRPSHVRRPTPARVAATQARWSDPMAQPAAGD